MTTQPPELTKASPEEGGQSREWVILSPCQSAHNPGPGRSQIQLFFNEAMSTSACNRAFHVGPPGPVVIEKLMSQLEEQENVDSTRSSVNFSALSKDHLLAAIKLAKRDLGCKCHESLNNSLVKHQQEDFSHTADIVKQKAATNKRKPQASSPKEKVTYRGAKLVVHTPQKIFISPCRGEGYSPPTRDPGPELKVASQESPLSKAICKLQNELNIYIQKIEQLDNRGHVMEEILEPDDQHKVEILQQKQAARSARIIYMLKQQVKEIQKDLDKLRSQKVEHTKKHQSRAMDKLAAALRGAVRVMQIFISQLPETTQGRVPSHHKELGQLLRQLSLCSAKVEVHQGSAVPETALDILQKLESLDVALSKQKKPWQRQVQACTSSLAQEGSYHRCTAPSHAPKAPATRGLRGSHRAAGPKKSLPGRRAVHQSRRAAHPPPMDHRQVVRAGPESLVHQKELKENRQELFEEFTVTRKGEALHADRTKVLDAGFQQPTVSSQLRVSKLPQKELSVPWIPTSLHSLPQQCKCSKRRRPEPRCLFSPSKTSMSSTKQKGSSREDIEMGLPSDKEKQAHKEALRQAWLDKMTIQRLRELNQLNKEEAESIQRLSKVVGFQQKARETSQPSLSEAQVVRSAEQLSEALLEDLIENTPKICEQVDVGTQYGLQAPTLESMLLRMDEIQKDQDEVRRRFASIAYSDPLHWDRGVTTGTQWCVLGSRPTSPQPIRLTRPVLRRMSTADIVLEKPMEAGLSVVSGTSLTEEHSQGENQQDCSGGLFLRPVERSRGTPISVPGAMLRSIQKYRIDHEAFLHLVAHEAVGSFNPWAIAESLAEELMSEALADVAAEFQDVCEEYAEAVFTSEFLQPIKSPPASILPLGSQ